MNKTLAIILFIGLGLIALISQLPKGNVSAKTEPTTNGGANRDANGKNTEIDSSKTEEMHAEPLTLGQQKQVATLKSSLGSAKTEANQALALEKLMRVFREFSKYDSAAIYAGQFSDSHPGINSVLRAGQAYFEAQAYAINPQKARLMGEKARIYFEKALIQDPNNLLVKTNLAMTYVDTPTPMKGITLLREVIEQEPTYIPALFNLGILSIKSNQFGKGQERFAQILKLDPTNYKAALNLGFCLAQLDKKEEAKKVLKQVISNSKNPEELKAAKELLAEMLQK
jgi:tetratricopeptide (TPR) repeat protein